jgi:hypothetical protein
MIDFTKRTLSGKPIKGSESLKKRRISLHTEQNSLELKRVVGFSAPYGNYTEKGKTSSVFNLKYLKR